jgi:hypothetical protein
MGSSNRHTVRLVAHTGLSTLLTLALLVAVSLSGGVGPATAQDAADKAKDAADKKDSPPAPKPKVKLGLHINDSKALAGYTLLSTMNSKSIYLLDNEGRIVHTWKPETTSMHCCYLLPNGHLLRPAELGGREKSFGGGPAPLGRVQEFTWDGEVVWDYTFFNDKQLPHHDITKMPNGNVLMISWDKKNVEECIAAGRKPELVSKYLLPDSIIEVKPTGKNSGEVVWEWHLWDHLIQDHDSTKSNYGVVADHPELVDVNHAAEGPGAPAPPTNAAKKDDAKKDDAKKDDAKKDDTSKDDAKKDDAKKDDAKKDDANKDDAKKDDAKKDGADAPKGPQAKSKADVDRLKSIGYAGSAASQSQRVDPDWTHVNSVDYNADLDQILLSVPAFSEIWVVDHGTTTAEAAGHTGGRRGHGGDLLYRWGNPANYRAGGPADKRLFFQHNAQWIPKGLPGEGHVLLFNNGSRRKDGTYSSVDEIVLPVDDSGFYPKEDKKPWGPAEPVWSYSAPKKSDFYSSFISGTHRLPNGDTMICSGANGTLFEVTPDKEIVWKYVNPAKGGFGPGGPPPPNQVLNGFLQDALGLKPDQRKDVDAFQKEVDATIDKTLDEEQKKKLKQVTSGAGGFTLPGQIFSTSTVIQLKPNPEQKKALTELQKAADDKLEALLTDDQKKQFKQMKADFAPRGPGGPGPGPGGPGGPGGGGPPPGMFNGPPGGASLFRAYKYAAEYPGLAGRDLTPGQTVEEVEKPKTETKDADKTETKDADKK